MSRVQKAVLHFLVPVLVGLILGVNRAGVGEHLDRGMSVLFWIGISLAIWFIFELVTRLTAAILRPWQPHLIVVLIVGMLAASIPSRILVYSVVDAISNYRVDAAAPVIPPAIGFSWEFVSHHLISWSGFFIFWGALNLALVKVSGFERFGYRQGRVGFCEASPNVTEAQRPQDSQLPRFMTRLPKQFRGELIALSVEQHKLRVYTASGNALVSGSLSEANDELHACAIEGLRIHRSHWVARAAISRVENEGRGYVVRAVNGLIFPVGPTYIGLLKATGIIVDN